MPRTQVYNSYGSVERKRIAVAVYIDITFIEVSSVRKYLCGLRKINLYTIILVYNLIPSNVLSVQLFKVDLLGENNPRNIWKGAHGILLGLFHKFYPRFTDSMCYTIQFLRHKSMTSRRFIDKLSRAPEFISFLVRNVTCAYKVV